MRAAVLVAYVLMSAAPAEAQYMPAPSPQVVPAYDPDVLPPAVPAMMGSGLFVLGGFATGTMITGLALGYFDGGDTDSITLITSSFVFGAVCMGLGAWMVIGAMTGDMQIRSASPAWQWVGAVASLAGGIAWSSSLIAYLVDDSFDTDSSGMILAGIGLYLLSAVFLIDLGTSSGYAVAPIPYERGGGLGVFGTF
jgi:hypothetical protein